MMAHRWVMKSVGQPMAMEPVPAVPLEAGEVRVQVAGCGVCHTDLGFYYDGVRTNHPLPLALGHEVSGRVVEAGAGAGNWMGRAVIVPAVIPCGECDACRRGRGTHLPAAEDARQRHPRRLRHARRRAGPRSLPGGRGATGRRWPGARRPGGGGRRRDHALPGGRPGGRRAGRPGGGDRRGRRGFLLRPDRSGHGRRGGCHRRGPGQARARGAARGRPGARRAGRSTERP